MYPRNDTPHQGAEFPSPSTDDASGVNGLADVVRPEAERIAAETAARSLVLRLTGSLAVYLHCTTHRDLLRRLDRRPYQDLDYVAYDRQKNEIRRMLEEFGYLMDPALIHAQEFGVNRLVYQHPETGLKIDVFLDEMRMAHTIDFRGRLERDATTVTLVDLLLSKLQIHEITENDLKDMVVLLAEHDLGDDDDETIDVNHLISVTSTSWGFYRTAMTNMVLLKDRLHTYRELSEDIQRRVAERIDTLMARMQAAPKSLRWKLRARVGDRVQWYETVEDVER